jgi:hypothetical protein
MKPIILIIFATLMFSCNATKVNTGMLEEQAPVIVYKTKNTYVHNVPITMNSSKEQITSYPAPSDLFFEGELALPLELKDGYFLDLRGISANTVFTSFTYEEYSKLANPPSIQELLESVIDRDPFISIYDCGKRGSYADLVKEINTKIRKGMEGCKEMKLP